MKKEIWKEIEGYKGLYLLSNYGKVKSLTIRGKNGFKKRFDKGKELVLSPGITCHGYKYVKMTDAAGIVTRHYIHKLVAQMWVPNTENKKCVNHIDGNKTNNRVDNLEWVTHKENVRHSMRLNAERNADTFFKLRDFVMIDLSQNKVINTFNCLSDVNELYPEIPVGRVSVILRGKGKKTQKKYTFKWV